MFVYRRGPGQEYIRLTLGDIIEDLADYDKPLEIDSLKVRKREKEGENEKGEKRREGKGRGNKRREGKGGGNKRRRDE